MQHFNKITGDAFWHGINNPEGGDDGQIMNEYTEAKMSTFYVNPFKRQGPYQYVFKEHGQTRE